MAETAEEIAMREGSFVPPIPPRPRPDEAKAALEALRKRP